MVGLNTGIVSNPAAPFDGVNAFGLGREDGRVGIEGFLEPKYLAMPRTYAAAPGLGGAPWPGKRSAEQRMAPLRQPTTRMEGGPTASSQPMNDKPAGARTARGNWILVAVMALMLLVIPPVGALFDRVGCKPLLLTSAVGYIVLSAPAIMLLGLEILILQFLGLTVLGFLQVILVSSVPSTLPALFLTAVQYTGFALAYNFSTAFFTDPSQIILNQLIETTHNQLRAGV